MLAGMALVDLQQFGESGDRLGLLCALLPL